MPASLRSDYMEGLLWNNWTLFSGTNGWFPSEQVDVFTGIGMRIRSAVSSCLEVCKLEKYFWY